MDTFFSTKIRKYPSKFVLILPLLKIFSANGMSWDVQEMKYLKNAFEKTKIHPLKKKTTVIEDKLKLRQSTNTEKIQPIKSKVLRVRGR